MWRYWESKESVDNFIKENIKSDKGLIYFIRGFTKKYSNYPFSTSENVFWKINLKYMEEFVDPEQLKSRIEKLAYSMDILIYDEDNKRAIKLFLEEFDDS